MLKNLRKEMKRTKNEWGRAFTEELRRRGGDVASAERLKGLVAAFPDMAAQLRLWAQEPGVPGALRRLQEFAAAYARNPDDILSDKLPGLFGYLDDAYLTARIYDATVLNPAWDRDPGAPPPGAYEKDLPFWLAEIRRVIPTETERIDAMLRAVVEGIRSGGGRSVTLEALE